MLILNSKVAAKACMAFTLFSSVMAGYGGNGALPYEGGFGTSSGGDGSSRLMDKRVAVAAEAAAHRRGLHVREDSTTVEPLVSTSTDASSTTSLIASISTTLLNATATDATQATLTTSTEVPTSTSSSAEISTSTETGLMSLLSETIAPTASIISSTATGLLSSETVIPVTNTTGPQPPAVTPTGVESNAPYANSTVPVSTVASTTSTGYGHATYTPEGKIRIILKDEQNFRYKVDMASTGRWTHTNVIQSITHLTVKNLGDATCVLIGIDGLVLVLKHVEANMKVRPPQVIVGGYCSRAATREELCARWKESRRHGHRMGMRKYADDGAGRYCDSKSTMVTVTKTKTQDGGEYTVKPTPPAYAPWTAGYNSTNATATATYSSSAYTSSTFASGFVTATITSSETASVTTTASDSTITSSSTSTTTTTADDDNINSTIAESTSTDTDLDAATATATATVTTVDTGAAAAITSDPIWKLNQPIPKPRGHKTHRRGLGVAAPALPPQPQLQPSPRHRHNRRSSLSPASSRVHSRVPAPAPVPAPAAAPAPAPIPAPIPEPAPAPLSNIPVIGKLLVKRLLKRADTTTTVVKCDPTTMTKIRASNPQDRLLGWGWVPKACECIPA